MQITETPWEERNLGVSSSAVFTLNANDSFDDIKENVLCNSKYIYQEAHVPVNTPNLLNLLTDAGFHFSEMMINLSADLRKDLENPFAKYLNIFSYHAASADECGKIYQAMRSGDIFTTDKIALNPHFGPKIAGTRYALWTEDEIRQKRAAAYIVSYQERSIGFFILKTTGNKTGHSMLAGLFDVERYKGMGAATFYCPMAAAKAMNMEKIITGVSSNNPDSLKLHLTLGYQIKDMHYVLSKVIGQHGVAGSVE